MKNPEPRALHKRPPRRGSTVAILACLLSNIDRKQTVYLRIGEPEALDSRFRDHRERECRIAQRHVVTREGFCYLHS
jgi:hypothetical protein